MKQENAFCYSPFSPSSTFTPRNQALLLQFALMALVKESTEGPPPHTAIREHLLLLVIAFPHMGKDIEILSAYMQRIGVRPSLSARNRSEVLRKFKPFLHICKADEGMFLFLLKYGQHLDSTDNIRALLQDLYTDEFSTISLKMKELFTARGFAAAAKECVSLFQMLHHHV